MKLKSKLLISTALVFIASFITLIFLFTKKSDVVEERNNLNILKIYNTVPEKQQAELYKSQLKNIRKISWSDTVVEAISEKDMELLKQSIGGIFCTLEAEIKTAKIVVADKNFSVLCLEESKKIRSLNKAGFSDHVGMKPLFNRLLKEEENVFGNVLFENDLMFVASDIVYDYDDNVIGYVFVMCKIENVFSPAARALGNIIAVHINNGDKFYYISDGKNFTEDVSMNFLKEYSGTKFLRIKGKTKSFKAFVEKNKTGEDQYSVWFIDDITLIDKHKKRLNLFITGTFLLILFFAVLTLNVFLNKIIKPLADFSAKLLLLSGEEKQLAEQMADFSQQISMGSKDQVSSIKDASGSLENISAMTTENNTNCHAAKETSLKAKTITSDGSVSMDNMYKAIQDINESADNIASIIKNIQDIAFQTNLLALNAAVEAARAGDKGAGFAVVADEVRSLAKRAGEAASSTAEIIDNTIERSRKAAGASEETASVFRDILKYNEELSSIISNISQAMREQDDGLNMINQSVRDLQLIGERNSDISEEVTSATKNINHQAEQVNSMSKHLLDMIEG